MERHNTGSGKSRWSRIGQIVYGFILKLGIAFKRALAIAVLAEHNLADIEFS